MISNIEAEAILKSYKYFEKTCSAIDGFIFNYAINYGGLETSDLTDKISDLMERKNKLINLKLIIDDCIAKLPKSLQDIATLRIKLRCTVENLAMILKVSIRTCFRKLNKLTEAFADILNNCSYKEKIEEMIEEEKWIMEIQK